MATSERPEADASTGQLFAIGVFGLLVLALIVVGGWFAWKGLQWVWVQISDLIAQLQVAFAPELAMLAKYWGHAMYWAPLVERILAWGYIVVSLFLILTRLAFKRVWVKHRFPMFAGSLLNTWLLAKLTGFSFWEWLLLIVLVEGMALLFGIFMMPYVRLFWRELKEEGLKWWEQQKAAAAAATPPPTPARPTAVTRPPGPQRPRP